MSIAITCGGVGARVSRRKPETALDAKMIMQVHDELVFEVADEACETLYNNVTERMANVIELQVPLLTEVGVGADWDEAH